ncbi:MAG: FAD-binding oxidoreductase [Gammaproteobacteria bacterium]|nr:FAD-binding oxidoreductase [Gammaproteobacteria bacterium]
MYEELRQLLDGDGLLTAAQEVGPYLVDHRRLYQGRALGVALPRTTAQVSALLGWCNAHGVGVVPQGGNTGYCGGATPDESGRQLVIALGRLKRVRAVDAANFSLTVEAGCLLADVQRAAAAAGRSYPVSLGSEGSCQIGGNLATNAGGLNVLRFGMTREQVLGLEVVLADGRILNALGGLRKDNTGYDLKSLFIGSEGTLGIITAATLRLLPPPVAQATAFVAVRDVATAIDLLGRLRAASGDALNSFELIPAIALELVSRHIPGCSAPLDTPSPWYVLCELTSPAPAALDDTLQGALAAALDAGRVQDAALATNERQRQEFWRLRESIPEAQRLAGPSLKHDIAVPVSALPEFVARAAEWVRREVPEGVLVGYGHAGDGNLHFTINLIDRGADAGAFKAREPAIRRVIHDLVAALGGSISAEHGIGRLKRAELARYADPVELELMRTLKRALDPKGIMNPGKVL